MFIQFTHVDALTLAPISEAPATNGPTYPKLDGLVVIFSNQSEWPCSVPLFYGTCDDGVNPETPGILAVLDEEQFLLLHEAERSAQLTRQKLERRRLVNHEFSAAMAALAELYPEQEVLSWPQQVKEAEAVQSGSEASSPLLDAIAQARGIVVTDLAARVLEKMAAYARASGALIGRRQCAEDRIEAAETVQAVAEIQW